MPSLFSNNYSRGPLYQYWQERAAEEAHLRDTRVEEAKLRAKGLQPLNAAYGPSSRESFADRRARGPPSYVPVDREYGSSSMAAARGQPGNARDGVHERVAGADDLPSYTAAATSISSTANPSTSTDAPLPSASEEKSNLQHLQSQREEPDTASDAAIARTLSSDEHARHEHINVDDMTPTREAERKKSVGKKVGIWFVEAATGFTKNQKERW